MITKHCKFIWYFIGMFICVWVFGGSSVAFLLCTSNDRKIKWSIAIFSQTNISKGRFSMNAFYFLFPLFSIIIRHSHRKRLYDLFFSSFFFIIFCCCFLSRLVYSILFFFHICLSTCLFGSKHTFISTTKNVSMIVIFVFVCFQEFFFHSFTVECFIHSIIKFQRKKKLSLCLFTVLESFPC